MLLVSYFWPYVGKGKGKGTKDSVAPWEIYCIGGIVSLLQLLLKIHNHQALVSFHLYNDWNIWVREYSCNVIVITKLSQAHTTWESRFKQHTKLLKHWGVDPNWQKGSRRAPAPMPHEHELPLVVFKETLFHANY